MPERDPTPMKAWQDLVIREASKADKTLLGDVTSTATMNIDSKALARGGIEAVLRFVNEMGLQGRRLVRVDAVQPRAVPHTVLRMWFATDQEGDGAQDDHKRGQGPQERD